MLESAIAESLPCVIDADGMWSVLRQPELVRGSRWTVLTPNKPEYARLRAALGQDGQEGGAGAQTEEQAAVELARALGGPVLVRKGETDLVSDGERLLPNTEQGCPKRSGGQGDVLAGKQYGGSGARNVHAQGQGEATIAGSSRRGEKTGEDRTQWGRRNAKKDIEGVAPRKRN